MRSSITLSIANGSPLRQRYSFTEPARCLVGRGEDCDIHFPTDLWHANISRHHCLLTIDPPRVEVRDLGSLTGTRVNGMLIGQRAPDQAREEVDLRAFPSCTLEEGDEICVGPVVLRVSREVVSHNRVTEFMHRVFG
jgi:serine/threonine-protein kinase